VGKSEKWHWILYGEDDGDVEYEEGEGPQRFQLVDETGGLILEGTRWMASSTWSSRRG